MSSEISAYGNPYGIPFTRDELEAGLSLVHPAAFVEQMLGAIYDAGGNHRPGDAVIGITLGDADLLAVSTASEEMSERVIRFVPHLRDAVALVRADSNAFLAQLQRTREEDDG